MDPLRIFIGYDSKEPVAWHVAAHSILKRSSVPVEIVPLVQEQLRKIGLYTRERGKTESTEFSMTRFLVPHLCDYKGWALFVDCDILCKGDIADLFQIGRDYQWDRDPGSPMPGVFVAQHDYETVQTTKFLGQVNVSYPRKNWSSV